MGGYVLAVDVGATNLRVGLISTNGKLIDVMRVPTPKGGDPNAVALKVIDLGRKLMARNNVAKVEAVGVGSIGPLNIREGIVVGTPNNPLRNFKLKEPLSNAFNAPAYVVNDCVAAVWGEYWAGAGRDVENVVYVTISSGIGAGAVVDGHLLLGKDGNAHEVGHIVLDLRSDIRCGCGAKGHWEGLASGNNIPRFASVLASGWRGLKSEAYILATQGKLRAATLFELWRKGDVFATAVIKELEVINAAGIASVINVYDPEVVSVGGSVALRNPDFMSLVFGRVKEFLINREPELTLTPLGDDAVLVGAAWIAIKPPEHLLRIQSLDKVHKFASKR